MDKITLKQFAAAGFPAVAIATADEDRAIAHAIETFDLLKTELEWPHREILKIAAIGGLLDARSGAVLDKTAQYPAAFTRAKHERITVIVLDLQHVLQNAAMYRMLRDALPAIKVRKSTLILIAPAWKLPAEIEHDVPVIHDALPSREELSSALDLCAQSTESVLSPSERSAMLDAGTGCTIAEFENSTALAYTCSQNDGYDPKIVLDQKMKLVRQSGLAEIFEPADPASFGGYETAVQCLRDEVIPNMHDPELAVSGIISDGVPGTGKTHLARVLAAMLGYPLVYVSIARLKGQYVGESEKNMAAIFRLARAIQPVVLLFDELEKGLAGSASNGDSGVSKGLEGIFLTETQNIRDSGDRILIVATTNDYQLLPAPVTRRLEIKFFHDVPTRDEREGIAAIKLARYAPDAKNLAPEVAALTHEWTGAEIEDLVRSAARRTQRKITSEALKLAAADIRPIAKTRAAEIAKLREWGRANLRLANSPEVPTSQKRNIGKVN